jgi:hypothetical protein
VWDASNEIVKDGLWKDSLDVGISTKELKNFIDYEAYD